MAVEQQQQQQQQRTQIFLWGFPISHSAAPPFLNAIFEGLSVPHRYGLKEQKTVDWAAWRDLLKAPTSAGCAVTMPFKVDAMAHVDELAPAAKEIGSINTVVLVSDGDDVQLVGHNFDWCGVRNSLLLPLHRPLDAPTPFENGGAAFIIGGGGTTRAAVYALAGDLKLAPIYLINRDEAETAQIVAQFPQYDLRPLTSPDDFTDEIASRTVAGVGAIPSIPPATDAERNVYAIADRIFDSVPRLAPTSNHLPSACNNKPLYLEMPYKPRRTLLFEKAEAAGFEVIGGIEAMIEQGLAQARAWLFASAASPYTGQSDAPTFIPQDIEDRAREIVRNMADIVTPPKA